MSTAIETPQDGPKQNEFNDGRIKPPFTWSDSFKDWIKQATFSGYSDAQVEERLLSILPFYPESDGKRIAKVINTPISNGNYIHEFYIENTEKPVNPDPNAIKDVVLVHGYAASLGLFIDNFDDLSSIPGIKIHAIDLLGFGFSARPSFPHYPSNTKADIYKIEDWFIDSIEEWRRNKKLDKFILMGHSFGGYLSCAYVLKYNKNLIDAATGRNLNPVEKLVLISPVGLERNELSIKPEEKAAASSGSSGSASVVSASDATLAAREAELAKEVNMDQEDIINDKVGRKSSLAPTSSHSSIESASGHQPPPTSNMDRNKSRTNLIRYLWKNNYSPFAIVRNLGPAKSKMISNWTTHRFAHVYYQDPAKFRAVHDYIYRVFNGKGSGEYAITRVLAIGALPKLPLLDRCPEKFAKMNLPTLWMYGDKDWMNEKAGYQMTKEINKAAGKKIASFGILPNSGHHLYLDNPQAFSKTVFKFLNFKK